MLLAGVSGVAFEVVNPGLLVPGLAGGLLLIVGCAGAEGRAALPVALPLLLLGAALLLLSRYRSRVLPAIGGVLALSAGAVTLVSSGNPLAIRVPPVILVAVAATALFLAAIAGAPLRIRKDLPDGGRPESGTGGVAATPLFRGEPGRVVIAGEFHRAVSRTHAEKGNPVRVIGTRRGVLDVEPVGGSCSMRIGQESGGRREGAR